MIVRMLVVLAVLLVTPVSSAMAEDVRSWPRDVNMDSGTITVYEPQIDSLKGDTLTGRAAIAYKARAVGEPVFGATWFTGKVNIDRDEGKVSYRNLEMTDVRFPKGNEKAEDVFTSVVKKSFTSWNLSSSLESLKTSLAASDTEARG